MLSPLKAVRDVRARLARLEQLIKEARAQAVPMERRVDEIGHALARQQDALMTTAHALEAVERVLKTSVRESVEVKALLVDAGQASRTSADEIEQQIKRHTRRVKSLQADVERHFAKVQGRLAKLRVPFDAPADEAFLDCARPVVESQRTLLGYDRLYVLWQAVRNTMHLDLPAVEIGSFRGGSAFLIAHALRIHAGADRELHVVDTFQGHIDGQITEHDSESQRGKFAGTSYEDVREYLAGFPRVVVHQGNAPEVIRQWPDRAYALVHLDVDLYEPTRDCLQYFVPRLASGGVMVLDDYGAPSCPGVERAVREVVEPRSDFQRWDTRSEQLVLVRR